MKLEYHERSPRPPKANPPQLATLVAPARPRRSPQTLPPVKLDVRPKAAMKEFLLCTNCVTPDECVRRFRDQLPKHELIITLDSTLRSHPQSVHLHLRKLGERAGVLEYTMAPQTGRAWLSYHENRWRPWIEAVVASLILKGCGPSTDEAKT